jgi:hypothetical protein
MTRKATPPMRYGILLPELLEGIEFRGLPSVKLIGTESFLKEMKNPP